MSKRVVVVASGETERRALPSLVGHLRANGIVMDDVRVPPAARSARRADGRTPRESSLVRGSNVEAGQVRGSRRRRHGRSGGRAAAFRDAVASASSQRSRDDPLCDRPTSSRSVVLRRCGRSPRLARGFARKRRHIQPRCNPEPQASSQASPRPAPLHVPRFGGHRSSLDPASIAMRSPSFRRFQLAVTNGNPED